MDLQVGMRVRFSYQYPMPVGKSQPHAISGKGTISDILVRTPEKTEIQVVSDGDGITHRMRKHEIVEILSIPPELRS